MEINSNCKASASSLRWEILRRAALHRAKNLGAHFTHRFLFVYDISVQRVDYNADVSDFEICDRFNIDNTGLVCKFFPFFHFFFLLLSLIVFLYLFKSSNLFPLPLVLKLEDCWRNFKYAKVQLVVVVSSLTLLFMYRSKRVIELGLGYGLAGLAIASATEAFEVVISDGNPQVVDFPLCD
ncbi:hypothetical protein DITRI_Ditri16bG0007700 [Diplodiscus trichospermus]